jgi:hypothetical protein
VGLHGLGQLRPLLANVGLSLGKGFLDQHFDEVRKVVDTNISCRRLAATCGLVAGATS